MSLRFAVVREATADFILATDLADRVLVETIGWLDEDGIDYQREWVKTDHENNPLTWAKIKNLAGAIGINARGHFNGEPGRPDAVAARRAILYLRETIPDLDAILLIRDQDAEPERRIGLEQARERNRSELAIVIGLAVVEREAWVLSGFEPRDKEEQARVDSERQTLGFNPCEQSHELTACKDDQAPRSPKRVLRSLSDDTPDREQPCWKETPLDRLQERGEKNGLAAYLKEIRDRLAPLIGHVETK